MEPAVEFAWFVVCGGETATASSRLTYKQTDFQSAGMAGFAAGSPGPPP